MPGTFDTGLFDTGTFDDLTGSAGAAGTYTTAAAVRAALGGISTSVLTDDAAVALILDSEDVVDGMLGGWWPDETTGRKIIQSRVFPWQWEKLDRATAKMAAAIYRNPQLITGQQYDRIKGPDFEREGPIGAAIGTLITTILDQSGLRRITGRATPHQRYVRGDYQRFLDATRHNGT